MNNWLFPCNPKYYNYQEAFEKLDYVYWIYDTTKFKQFNKKDIVYIYISSPIKEIKYKCEIIDIDLDNDHIKKDEHWKTDIDPNQKYLKLKLLKEYEKGISYQEMKNISTICIMRKSKINDTIATYIESKN